MTRGRLYRLEGIVLARRNQGEADRVLQLLAEDGLHELIAHGVRKPTSRKGGHLELFNRVRLLVARSKSSWDVISQAETVAFHPRLREDFRRATYARHLAELVLAFFAGEADARLLRLMAEALDRLEQEDEAHLEPLVRREEQRLLDLAGYRPSWGRCVRCGAELHPRREESRPYGLSAEEGGALCPACYAAGREETGGEAVRPLSPSALSWLQALQRRPWERLRGWTMPAATRRELARVMERYIAWHLERRPSALRLTGSTSS